MAIPAKTIIRTTVLIALLCVTAVMVSAAESKNNLGDKPMLRLEDIHIRDPFILPVEAEKAYYMYGTMRAMPDGGGGPSFETYVSKDLKEWEGPIRAFGSSPDFWGTMHYWAPEVHRYLEKYYLFGTFGADKVLRATQILVSDSPRGPFKPLTDRPITPFGWQCLDGTLFVDDAGKLWVVFCHEWEQTHDGEICAMRLTEDLKYSDGKPVLLFRASEAPWVAPVPWAAGDGDVKNYITDGPFIYRTKGGELLMLWSSFGKNGYVQAVARSKSGKITGPWTQEADLVFDQDGGHGMLFHTFDGKLMLTLHTPNSGGRERAKLIPVRENDSGLVLE